MKNQITILFAGRLLAANAVMAAPSTAQTGFTSYGGSNYIAIAVDPLKSKLGDNQGAMADWTKASELYRTKGDMDSYKRVMNLIEKHK